MEEHKARNKLCPMARVHGDNLAMQMCRGSDCMAWRWHTQERIEIDTRKPFPAPVKTIEEVKDGYCGMTR